MDYTILGRNIADLLERKDVPLSEDQRLLMQGFIAGFLANVETNGLEFALNCID